MNIIRESSLEFDQLLAKLQEKVAENNFRVLHVHNVKQTLAEKGFSIDNYSIVEVCNAKFANSVINFNKEYGTMMPCKIVVYSDNGKNYLVLPLPTELAKRFGMEGADEIAGEVERVLINVVEQTIKN